MPTNCTLFPLALSYLFWLLDNCSFSFLLATYQPPYRLLIWAVMLQHLTAMMHSSECFVFLLHITSDQCTLQQTILTLRQAILTFNPPMYITSDHLYIIIRSSLQKSARYPPCWDQVLWGHQTLEPAERRKGTAQRPLQHSPRSLRYSPHHPFGCGRHHLQHSHSEAFYRNGSRFLKS